MRVGAARVDAADDETMDMGVGSTRARMARRIYALKGATGNRPAIRASDTKGTKLFIVGVDSLKGQLASRLTRGRTVRFSDRSEGRFYEELASERLFVRYVRGALVRLRERILDRRAESLDCVIYGMAVRYLVTANLDRREEEVASATMPKPRPTMAKSARTNRVRIGLCRR